MYTLGKGGGDEGEGIQKSSKIRPQDGALFVPSRLELDPCPKCKNMSLMALEDLAFVKKKKKYNQGKK